MDERRAMDRAMELAVAALPHPNPRVGAVVLDTAGEVVGSGFHEAAGRDHAEVVALRAAGDRAAGGTLVVTLEPCAHAGRTPPCTDAIVAAGIARVIVGVVDPDPRVAGAGLVRLESAGVGTEVLADPAIEALDPGYFHHRRTGRPLVTLKTAMTLDGQTAAADGTSQWITSPEARADGHRLRAAADAVMVGAGTLRSDDPLLTVRTPGYQGRQPRPVLVGGRGPLPGDARLFERDPIVFVSEAVELPGTVIVAPGDDGVDLAGAIEVLGAAGIVDLLVEGGARLAGRLLAEGLVDRGVFYMGAALAGGSGRPVFDGVFATIGDVEGVRITSVRRVGPDVRIDFTVEER
jgi:diaminohydroxyphosphoribosylaminopyrimidine deaminase/5-amino-6-(5-phosphoribosylamino)uracil reductase